MGASTKLQIGCLAFLFGVIGAAYFRVDWSGVLLFFAVIIGASAFVAPASRIALFIVGIFFAGGIYFFQTEWRDWISLPETVVFHGEARILDLEHPRIFYRAVTLLPTEEHLLGGARILWKAPITYEATPGDQVMFQCNLKRPENFDPEFDYRSYLVTKRIGYVCERQGKAEPLLAPRFSFDRFLFSLRETISTNFEVSLPEPVAGFALGLILGGNDYLAKELTDEFARTGLSHIVAVSGFNMAILVQCTIILGWLVGLSRKSSVLFSGVIILIFLFLIGAPASAVRAVIMAGVGFLAYFLGRLPASFSTLFLAAGVMLALNPLLIRYDVGFQLSFLATLALLTVSPFIESWTIFRSWWGKALALLFLTVVIELFTWPVLLSTFDQMTWLAPVTNMLVLPVIPAAMLLALGITPVLIFLPAATPFVVAPLYAILSFVLWVVHFFASLPFGLWHFSGIIIPVIPIVWYTALFLIFWYLYRTRRYAVAFSQ